MVTKWMLLAVPTEDYEELKHMIDFRQAQRGKAAAPSPDELRGAELKQAAVIRTAFNEHETWPAQALQRLAAGSTATTERFSRAMDVCAEIRSEAPDFPMISTSDLAQRTGMSVEEWRAACRKMTAHLQKHYPDVPRWPTDRYSNRPFWPLVSIAGRTLGVYDQLYVGITEEQAESWSKIRNGG